ncbi:DUF6624 domain-containing protein [Sphingobacterium sp. 40-24]|uniref:DUF6624 domain-containing protein n=1 Tax=Sphingobacterium sp. 40-24 TaxID=1895843 RepID=UPI0009620FF6|nr:DUF6624 domain-containing protein [Sphingobacterium sp. 40-24]OJZ15113.1 MAG: hypothetical protein BGP15_23590 [Sphingobacterium sp. 40-24]
MFKPFLILFLIFISCHVKAQKSSSYFYLKNTADSLIFEKKTPEAYLLYRKMVKISDIDPFIDIELVKLALKVKDSKTAEKYLKQSILNGASLGMLEVDSNVNSFLKHHTNWRKTYDLLRQKHLSKIAHLEDRITLLNMLEKDQGLRSLLGVIEYKKADSLIFASDTANMAVIKEIIARTEFPNLETVGMDGINAIFILLLHTLNNGIEDAKNIEILTPLMKKAVIDLKYPPFNMALVIDRHRAIIRQKQIYGSYWEMGKQNKRIVTPIENIDEVDVRRKEIGLPPLSLLRNQRGYELPVDYKN